MCFDAGFKVKSLELAEATDLPGQGMLLRSFLLGFTLRVQRPK